MKLASARLVALGGAVAMFAAGCGAMGGNDDGDDPTSGESEANPLAEEMRAWPGGCDVLDNLQPIVDYMQIEEIDGGSLNNNAWGEGMDGEALTCNGLVTVSTWERIDGSVNENDGELWGGIVPWENEDQAKESYVDRTQDDVEDLQSQDSSLEVVNTIELGSEWDEGQLIAMQNERGNHSLLMVGRDGQWLFFAEVNYSVDTGEQIYSERSDQLPGTIEDYAYPFEDEALQQWLATDYASAVNQSINDRIGQE